MKEYSRKEQMELNKTIAIKVMNWTFDKSLSDKTLRCEVIKSEEITNHEVLYTETFEPASNFEDAWLVAEETDLFSRFVLHKHKGAYSEDWAWHISYIDTRGVLQGFVAAETPELAICLAVLKQMNAG